METRPRDRMLSKRPKSQLVIFQDICHYHRGAVSIQPPPSYASWLHNTMTQFSDRLHQSEPTPTWNSDVPRTLRLDALSTDTGLHTMLLRPLALRSITGDDGVIMDERVKRYIVAHFRDRIHHGLPVRLRRLGLYARRHS
ncbi:hypothetical protein AcV7_005127 [Taiwanofungus camphoratus]|nr:hypothetical protein AcV7_005127 [Antrodia cinnamomea]